MNTYFYNGVFFSDLLRKTMAQVNTSQDSFKNYVLWSGYSLTQTPQAFVALLIRNLLVLLGLVFIALTVYAGYLWMTAHGNDDQVSKAKEILTNSIIGIIIVFGAYAITYYLLGVLAAATKNI